MPRGGRDKTLEREGGLDRRCIATGESAPREGLIRFVADERGQVLPDLGEKLGGRGVWVSARRDALEKAVAKGMFARSFKRSVTAADDLPERVETLLVRRAVEALALARKAGQAVCGFERVREALLSGKVAGLLAAADGSDDGKRKLRALAEDAAIVGALDGAELGLAFGRESVIDAALLDGGATTRALRETRRLGGFRS